MRVLIIDNYDSFTFNLYQYVGEILSTQVSDFSVQVKRNDEITLQDVEDCQPSHIIISPGPGTPEDQAYFGVCSEVILNLGKVIPLMGVCLGMQGIAHCFGGKVIRAPLPMHGKVSAIRHDDKGFFKGLPQELEVMRYHSLMADAVALPECLEITAVVMDEKSRYSSLQDAALGGCEVMGVRHKNYPIEGIQFHPESFATEGGKGLIKNFLFPS